MRVTRQQLIFHVAKLITTMSAELEHHSNLKLKLHVLNQIIYLERLEMLLRSPGEDVEIIPQIKSIMAERWADIQGTAYEYCAQPREALNELWLEIAHWLAPLPPSLDDYETLQVGEGPYFMLMPTVEVCRDFIEDTNIHRLSLSEFILSEDSRHYIPVVNTLDYGLELGSDRFRYMVSCEKIVLNQDELTRLENHSQHTANFIMRLRALKQPTNSLGYHLKKLENGLRAGGVNQRGKEYDAGADATEAIYAFFQYWNSLSEILKISILTQLPRLQDVIGRLARSYEVNYRETRFCVQIIANIISFEILGAHKDTLTTLEEQAEREDLRNTIEQLRTIIPTRSYQVQIPSNRRMPMVSQLLYLEPTRQQQIIHDYFYSDYANILFYTLEHYPEYFSKLMEKAPKSPYLRTLLEQRSSSEVPLFLQVIYSYPHLIHSVLEASLTLGSDFLLNQLSTHVQGGKLLFVWLRSSPESLKFLLDYFLKSTQKQQLQLFKNTKTTSTNLLQITLGSDSNSYQRLCGIVEGFPKKFQYELLNTHNGLNQDLLQIACREFPHNAGHLLGLLKNLKPKQRTSLMCRVNSSSETLMHCALNVGREEFRLVYCLFLELDFKIQQQHVLARDALGDNLLMRAMRQSSDNLEVLLDWVEGCQKFQQIDLISQTDAKGNNLLLCALKRKSSSLDRLVRLIQTFDPGSQHKLLQQKNRFGLSPMISAVYQRSPAIMPFNTMIKAFSGNLRTQILQCPDKEGYHLPVISATFCPEFMPFFLEGIGEEYFLIALTQRNQDEETCLTLSYNYHPDLCEKLLDQITRLSVANPENSRILADLPWFDLVKLALPRPKDLANIHRRLKQILPYSDFLPKLYCRVDAQGNNLFMHLIHACPALVDQLFEDILQFEPSAQKIMMLQKNQQGQSVLSLAHEYLSLEQAVKIQNLIYQLQPAERQPLLQQTTLAMHVTHSAADTVESPARERVNPPTVFKKLCRNSRENLITMVLSEEFNLLHTLSLAELKKLLLLTDGSGNTLLWAALTEGHHRVDKILDLISEFSPKDQHRLLVHKNSGDCSLIGYLATRIPSEFVRCFQRLDGLSSDQQLSLILQTYQNTSLLSSLARSKLDFELLPYLFDLLEDKHQINLLTTPLENGNKLAMIMPKAYVPLLLNCLKKLPTGDKINIFCSLNFQGNNLLMVYFKEHPEYLPELLKIAVTLPKHIQGKIYSCVNREGYTLARYIAERGGKSLQILFWQCLKVIPLTYLETIFCQNGNSIANPLLQTLFENNNLDYTEIVELIRKFPLSSQTKLLGYQNRHGKCLLSQFAETNDYLIFNQLAAHISQMPQSDKVKILSLSNLFPCMHVANPGSYYPKPAADRFLLLSRKKDIFPAILHLLQTLTPEKQLEVLNWKDRLKQPLYKRIAEPERSQLQVIRNQAKMLFIIEESLRKFSNLLQDRPHTPECLLYEKLHLQFEVYLQKFEKNAQDLQDLALSLSEMIRADWTGVEDKATLLPLIKNFLNKDLRGIIKSNARHIPQGSQHQLRLFRQETMNRIAELDAFALDQV